MEKTISVAAARRRLGSLAKAMTDDQVQEMLNTLHLLAREQVLYNGSKVTGNSNEPKQLSTAS